MAVDQEAQVHGSWRDQYTLNADEAPDLMYHPAVSWPDQLGVVLRPSQPKIVFQYCHVFFSLLGLAQNNPVGYRGVPDFCCGWQLPNPFSRSGTMKECTFKTIQVAKCAVVFTRLSYTSRFTMTAAIAWASRRLVRQSSGHLTQVNSYNL